VNPTFQLGRIAGIRISVNWSWLIVFALIVWSLAAAVFPSQNPGFSNGEYVALAVAAAILFFASLLLPALPLDGGRVLRSALWQLRGDLRWATWVASGVGRGFGFLFIALGVFLFIVEGL
jgi:Zn-dependent protease